MTSHLDGASRGATNSGPPAAPVLVDLVMGFAACWLALVVLVGGYELGWAWR